MHPRNYTNDQARVWREEFAANVAEGQPLTIRAFAISRGVKPSAMKKLLRGLSYADADGPLFRGRARYPGSPRATRKLDAASVQAARLAFAERLMSIRQLSRELGVSISVIQGALYGETYRDAGGPFAVRGARRPHVRVTRGFPPEKREAVIRSVLDDGLTIQRAALLHGVSWCWAQKLVIAARRARVAEAAE